MTEQFPGKIEPDAPADTIKSWRQARQRLDADEAAERALANRTNADADLNGWPMKRWSL